MAYTEYTVDEVRTIIRTIETAWAKGIKSVQFSDRGTVYIDQYEERLRYFNGVLIRLLGGRSRMTYLTAEKGL